MEQGKLLFNDNLDKEEWNYVLQEPLSRLNKVTSYLKEREAIGYIIYPMALDIYKAFGMTRFKDVKVVILGQDPYHDGNADGLAFSCKDHSTPSIRKIFESIQLTVSTENKVTHQTINLERWAKQGILLLNAVLTVEKGVPNSHKNLGWEELTSAAIRSLSDRREKIIFLLWGGDAKKLALPLIDQRKHFVIISEHPAAASYAKRVWNSNDCFNLANKYLDESLRSKIIW